eukprot:g5727.t1 g5727   contig2:1165262-1165627(-)
MQGKNKVKRKRDDNSNIIRAPNAILDTRSRSEMEKSLACCGPQLPRPCYNVALMEIIYLPEAFVTIKVDAAPFEQQKIIIMGSSPLEVGDRLEAVPVVGWIDVMGTFISVKGVASCTNVAK